MSLYTERHGMRTPMEKTYTISVKAYSVIFDCCERYFENLAWKYPEECSDEGHNCCGIDLDKFSEDMEYEIPTLFKRNGLIAKPLTIKNVFEDEPSEEPFDQYALLDLIEYIVQNIRDITRRNYHSYFKHDHISFGTTNDTAVKFAEEVNAIFKKTGLLYQLTGDYEVERIEEASVLSPEIETNIAQIPEQGTKDLLITAIQKHKSPHPSDQRDAVEKIWDAFERLKSYYTSLSKKDSADKIIFDMADSKSEYISLFETEFKALTVIGNDFRIRHHETNKFDITDQRHYDYFFNRCLSLIALAIQYLH